MGWIGWPRIDTLGRWGFWLVFVGFNLTFLIMHLTGLLGMPRRIYTYEADMGWGWLNLVSSIGGFVMAIGVATIILDIALHFRFGRKASRNPWNADTLEWAMPMPVPAYNFISVPEVRTRHPMWEHPDLPETIAAGQHGLAEVQHERRDIWGSDAVTGEVREVINLPSNSWMPLQGATAIGIICVSLLAKFYSVALLATLISVFLLLRWSWYNGGHPSVTPLRDDDPTDPPLHSRTFDGPGLWGMVVALMANGALYLCLLFGWFYLWTASPLWRVPEQGPLAMMPFVASGVLLTLAVVLYGRGLARLRQRNADKLQGLFWLVSLIGLAHVLLLLWLLWSAPLRPALTAHDAVLAVMLLYQLIHSALAVVLTALQAVRLRLGYVSAAIPYEPIVVGPFWLYTLGVFWMSFAAFVLLPLAWGGA